MPRRSFKRSRSRSRSRGPFKRRRSVRRMRKTGRGALYRAPIPFKENSYYSTTVATDVNGNYFEALNFSITDISNWSNLAVIFDQFKLRKIVWRIWPNFADADSGDTRMPQIHSVIDIDDSTTPTAVSDLQQYDNYRTTFASAVKPHKRVLYPKMRQMINEIDTGVAIYRPVNGKIDNSADPTFLGIKWGLSNAGASTNYTLRFQVTYYFTMYGQR